MNPALEQALNHYASLGGDTAPIFLAAGVCILVSIGFLATWRWVKISNESDKTAAFAAGMTFLILGTMVTLIAFGINGLKKEETAKIKRILNTPNWEISGTELQGKTIHKLVLKAPAQAAEIQVLGKTTVGRSPAEDITITGRLLSLLASNPALASEFQARTIIVKNS